MRLVKVLDAGSDAFGTLASLFGSLTHEFCWRLGFVARSIVGHRFSFATGSVIRWRRRWVTGSVFN
jgi:hypothetical protein